ncbi:hypothetical protein BDV25DRAFT_151746 [Aspergillus avenaceus]|uniref:Uncharacterized protein n=1 Tax=Aspergillus avenaceus TaxID=36643 RepID=A0A5N6U044_ASPAV|nr:hypothetical protein BDV25DRAFT_151746 [Aspergillus avenaceus]
MYRSHTPRANNALSLSMIHLVFCHLKYLYVSLPSSGLTFFSHQSINFYCLSILPVTPIPAEHLSYINHTSSANPIYLTTVGYNLVYIYYLYNRKTSISPKPPPLSPQRYYKTSQPTRCLATTKSPTSPTSQPVWRAGTPSAPCDPSLASPKMTQSSPVRPSP